jgi:hypothetical protein
MSASKFFIPDEIQVKYPDLVKLVVATESMDDNEKQYWFDVLPQMTDARVDRLFTILDTERIKLEELERKYQEEMAAINRTHLLEWQELQRQRKTQDAIDAAQVEGIFMDLRAADSRIAS